MWCEICKSDTLEPDEYGDPICTNPQHSARLQDKQRAIYKKYQDEYPKHNSQHGKWRPEHDRE